MKLTLRNSAKFFAMLVAVSLVAFSCKKTNNGPADEPTPEPGTVLVKEIKLSDQTLQIVVEDTKTITATVTPEDAKNKTLTWASSNKDVATVENGKISALKVGETIISATAKDGSKVKAECKVVVVAEAVAVTEVKLDQSNLELVAGEATVTLKATVLPENATNKEVEWLTSNPAVATVTNGVVTAVAPGDATITVKTVDGEKTADCAVKVNAPKVDVTGVTIDGSKDVTIYIFAEPHTFRAVVAPADATNKNVSWKIGDETIAKVSQEGVVTGLKEGNTTVTVTTEEGNFSATVNITVEKGRFSNAEVPEDHPAIKVAETNYRYVDYQFFFATDNTINTSMYLIKKPVSQHFKDAFFEVNGNTFAYLPKKANFLAVIPSNDYFNFSKDVAEGTASEVIKIGGPSQSSVTNTYDATYSVKNSICYAVKMYNNESNDYRTAYRYKWVKDAQNNLYFEIKVKYLGVKGANIEIVDVANEDFWSVESEINTVISLPACGYNAKTTENVGYNPSSVTGANSSCNYWVLDDDAQISSLDFNENGVMTDVPENAARPIRLFKK